MSEKKPEKTLLESILSAGAQPPDTDSKTSIFDNEIDCISDAKIRSFVRAILNNLDAFWYSPASTVEGMHPPDEYGTDGLILHTKRVFRTAAFLMAGIELTPSEADCIFAAILLHDSTKAYWVNGGEDIAHDPLHAYTVDGMVKMQILFDQQNNVNPPNNNTLEIDLEDLELILKLIRFSHGVFSVIPETIPTNELENIVHLADMIAANVHIIIDGVEVKKERWT